VLFTVTYSCDLFITYIALRSNQLVASKSCLIFIYKSWLYGCNLIMGHGTSTWSRVSHSSHQTYKCFCHIIQSYIPKVVHDCKFDKHPMLSASGYSADCTELWMMSGELKGSWVLIYGHCLVSSQPSWVFSSGHCPMSSFRAEYWTMDTVRWAHGHLSIELWTLSGELMDTWVLNYGHCLVSSWTPEYWTMDTVWWAHGHLSI
jgi:hypothetical protein